MEINLTGSDYRCAKDISIGISLICRHYLDTIKDERHLYETTLAFLFLKRIANKFSTVELPPEDEPPPECGEFAQDPVTKVVV